MRARSAAGLAFTLSCGQLRHLIDTTAKPNATIQVMPSATAIRATLGYPITLLRFRVHEVPDVAYIEQLISSLYVHEHQQVSGTGWYWRRFSQPNRLTISAGCCAISDRTPM
jgi:hypothetical protein